MSPAFWKQLCLQAVDVEQYGGETGSTWVVETFGCVSGVPLARLVSGKNVIANDNDYAPQVLAA